jgi:hypothetical protein
MKHGFPKHQSGGSYRPKKHKVKYADFSSLIKVVQTCVRSIANHDYVEPKYKLLHNIIPLKLLTTDYVEPCLFINLQYKLRHNIIPFK